MKTALDTMGIISALLLALPITVLFTMNPSSLQEIADNYAKCPGNVNFKDIQSSYKFITISAFVLNLMVVVSVLSFTVCVSSKTFEWRIHRWILLFDTATLISGCVQAVIVFGM